MYEPSAHEVSRREIRRQLRARSILIASLATGVVLVALAVGVASSPGWPTVREYFFSGYHARESFPSIAQGFLKNVALFLLAEPLILALALALALARQARSPWLVPVRLLAVAYTDLFRGIPTILLVLLLGFGMPALGLRGVPNSLFFWALVALVLSYGAYVAEVIRSGIDSIHPSQVASARSLGLTRAQTMRYVVVPQALRRADLIVLMQENRILSNYWVWLTSWRCPGLLAFWGHGRNFQSAAPWGWRERWKAWWLLRADWWFTYTQGTRRYIAGQGFDIERITSLDNAVDDSGFLRDLSSVTDAQLEAARGNLGIGAGAQVAIFCGSLYPEKRIALLLASADLLHARLPDFHLLVLGDGPDAGLVKAALPDRPWLHWLGQRRAPEKALYYRCASVMLNPGAVGLHVVDAFIAQTPLVTQASAAHGPEYDYLVDGENGLSVAADSAASYAEAVATIFTQPGLLATMRAHCARDAGRYTLERMVQNFADGIVACLDRHGRLPASATGGSQPIHPS